jgi:CAAX protease family protein
LLDIRIWVPALFLAAVFILFHGGVQAALRRWIRTKPARVFVAPAILALVFWLVAWHVGVTSLPLAALILMYLFLPSACMYWQRPDAAAPTWVDAGVVLLLWLPIELSAGAPLIPKPAQGFLHTVAYGIAITSAIWLFLLFRGLEGMKYNLPRSAGDFVYPLAGFAVSAALLIPLGLGLGFLKPFHLPGDLTASRVVRTFLIIWAATALPEEILFRSLIQNGMMRVWGDGARTLAAAGILFGAAHLNNGPGALPNWRYMILASVAGIIYGKVFQKSGSVISSALLHALVNTTRHLLF